MISLFPNVAQRRLQPEVMDQPDLDAAEHCRALHGLGRINVLSRSAGILWRPLRDLGQKQLRILDLASGGGDVAVHLWHKAHRAGFDWHIEGWDVSPVAVDYARAMAEQRGAAVHFQMRDALTDPIPADFDAVVCSLFLHHLDADRARQLLRSMGQAARQLVLVNDLERCTLGLLAARWVTRLLSSSPVVHVDGPRSVEGAFTVHEAKQLADEAGLVGAAVTRRWPFRYLLTWRRP